MTQVEHNSFTFSTPREVSTAQFRSTITEVDEYDHLTVGSATEHGRALRKVVEFGSGCLMVADVGIVDGRTEPEDFGSQTETLFA